jgi:hypothetical protein
MDKTSKLLISLILGGVVVWIIFKVRKALAAPTTPITTKVPSTTTIRPQEIKLPKWQITSEQACYRSGNLQVCIPNPLGGLFKREDQTLKEAIETTLRQPPQYTQEELEAMRKAGYPE